MWRRMMSAATVVVMAVGMAACGTTSQPETPMAWVRTDGQSGRSNPALADQFAADRAACIPSGATDNAALQAAVPCMAKRGYVLVAADQAEATAMKFRGGKPVKAQ